jgi:transposase
MMAPSIGHLTASAFISTIEDSKRFRRSTDVGAYLGLVPRVHQSGEIDRMGRITKAGAACDVDRRNRLRVGD